MDSALGRVPRHCPQIFVDHRFSTHKQQVTDMVLDANINNIPRLLQGDTAPLFRVEAIYGESTEITFGITNVGYRKLQITWTAVIEHLPRQAPEALLGSDNGPRPIDGRSILHGCGFSRTR